MKRFLFFGLFWITLIFSCKKDNPDIDKDKEINKTAWRQKYIIVEDTATSVIYSFTSDSLDLNNDNSYDIFFNDKKGWIITQCPACENKIPYDDYSIKVTKNFYSLVYKDSVRLKSLSNSDTITSNDNFLSIDSLYIGRLTPNGYSSDWMDSKQKYIGFISYINNDTILYWVSFRFRYMGYLYPDLKFGRLKK